MSIKKYLLMSDEEWISRNGILELCINNVPIDIYQGIEYWEIFDDIDKIHWGKKMQRDEESKKIQRV